MRSAVRYAHRTAVPRRVRSLLRTAEHPCAHTRWEITWSWLGTRSKDLSISSPVQGIWIAKYFQSRLNESKKTNLLPNSLLWPSEVESTDYLNIPPVSRYRCRPATDASPLHQVQHPKAGMVRGRGRIKAGCEEGKHTFTTWSAHTCCAPPPRTIQGTTLAWMSVTRRTGHAEFSCTHRVWTTNERDEVATHRQEDQHAVEVQIGGTSSRNTQSKLQAQTRTTKKRRGVGWGGRWTERRQGWKAGAFFLSFRKIGEWKMIVVTCTLIKIPVSELHEIVTVKPCNSPSQFSVKWLTPITRRR